jgi:hypothetical protein
MRRMNFKKNRVGFYRIRRADRLFENDHVVLPAAWFPRKDAWADGIIDGVEKVLRSAGLKTAIWLIISFTAGYFAYALRVIINK